MAEHASYPAQRETFPAPLDQAPPGCHWPASGYVRAAANCLQWLDNAVAVRPVAPAAVDAHVAHACNMLRSYWVRLACHRPLPARRLGRCDEMLTWLLVPIATRSPDQAPPSSHHPDAGPVLQAARESVRQRLRWRWE